MPARNACPSESECIVQQRYATSASGQFGIRHVRKKSAAGRHCCSLTRACAHQDAGRVCSQRSPGLTSRTWDASAPPFRPCDQTLGRATAGRVTGACQSCSRGTHDHRRPRPPMHCLAVWQHARSAHPAASTAVFALRWPAHTSTHQPSHCSSAPSPGKLSVFSVQCFNPAAMHGPCQPTDTSIRVCGCVHNSAFVKPASALLRARLCTLACLVHTSKL